VGLKEESKSMPQIVVMLVIQATYAVVIPPINQLVHYSIRVAHFHHDPDLVECGAIVELQRRPTLDPGLASRLRFTLFGTEAISGPKVC